MKNKKNPLISIVVATFNGQKTIGNALNSLLKQSYPSEKYEIIVVDDNSKDKTCTIVKKYPVKLIRHKKNMGLAITRNTGLKNSRGEIYICFDDDCVADKDWLKEIVKVYQRDPSALGVCGLMKGYKDSTIYASYLTHVGEGNPPNKAFTQNLSVLRRFKTYISDKLSFSKDKSKLYEVGHLSGANSSFKVNDLKDLGGWDPRFRLAQDTELCESLVSKNPQGKFYCNPQALIYHSHPGSFLAALKKKFKKSKNLLEFYQKHNKTPPIFPFPIIIFILLGILCLTNLSLAAIGLLLIPQLIYFWWPIHFIRQPNFKLLLFPYMQWGLESSILLGILINSLKKK